jgi:diguanylate cyclase (GGDEF)-like protein/PAS domain S-box-containing protein
MLEPRQGACPRDGPTTGAVVPADTEHHAGSGDGDLDQVGRRFRRLVANSPDLIAIIGEGGVLTYANPVGERMFGYPEVDFLGRSALDVVHPEDRDRAATALLRDLTEPGPHPPATYRLMVGTQEYRQFEVRATNCLDDPLINGVVIVGRDVTDDEKQGRTLRMLGDVNRSLVHAHDEQKLLSDICRTIVDVGGYTTAWVGFLEEDDERTVRPVATCGNATHLTAIPVGTERDGVAVGPIGVAIQSRKVQVSTDIASNGAPAASRDAATAQGLTSSCILPLDVGGAIVGVLEVCSHEPEAFDDEEVTFLSELAESLAYGIGRIRDAISLTLSEERYRSLASASPIGILEVGESSDVKYANPRACEIAGVPPSALLGSLWIDVVHPDDQGSLLKDIEAIGDEVQSFTSRFRIRRPDGEVRHVFMSAAAKDSTVDSDWVVTVVDESEEVHAHEELTHQALYDGLTDLPNRALFLLRLRQELAWSEREHANIAVLFLDLDLFKLVNDSLGHDAGDAVLQEVSQRFLATIRGAETAARFGGDEFMFIIRNVEKADDAIRAARRLLDSLNSPIQYRGQRLMVTGSIGIVIPAPGTDAETVLRDADTAMYQAKAAGRNRFEVFDDVLHDRSVSRLQREGDLRSAIERHEFSLHYQPIVDPRDGRPVGAEALLRWQHPVHGPVPPLEFIPVAEESGLIRSIGAWVFEAALSQLAEWDEDLDGPHLELLSINCSARQLDDPDDVARIGQVLERLAIEPARVTVEVTETAAMADRPSTRTSLERFRDLGVQVSIDDFGTGYSSLAYLHTLPVSSVKVDRSFIERLDAPDGSMPVVSAILDLSHAMGLRVVAEGVSSPRLQGLVAELGCEYAQGFHWSEPLPPDEFRRWWRTARRRALGGRSSELLETRR